MRKTFEECGSMILGSWASPNVRINPTLVKRRRLGMILPQKTALMSFDGYHCHRRHYHSFTVLLLSSQSSPPIFIIIVIIIVTIIVIIIIVVAIVMVVIASHSLPASLQTLIQVLLSSVIPLH